MHLFYILMSLLCLSTSYAESDSTRMGPQQNTPVNADQSYMLDKGVSPLYLIEGHWQMVASTPKRCVSGYSPTYQVNFYDTKYVTSAINDINRIILDTSQGTTDPYDIWADNVYASTPGATSDTPIQFSWTFYCVLQ